MYWFRNPNIRSYRAPLRARLAGDLKWYFKPFMLTVFQAVTGAIFLFLMFIGAPLLLVMVFR